MSSSLTIPSQSTFQGVPTPRQQARKLKVIPSSTKVFRYNAGYGPNSHVTIEWCKGLHAKDSISRSISPLTKPMCLTKEEVRGQKVENELMLPQESSALQMIPGGIFDSQELLCSGEFKYLNWDKRTSYEIKITSALAKQTSATITTTEGSGLSEFAAASAIQSLTSVANLASIPIRWSSSEMRCSTFQESMGLSIGASFFYMGLSGEEAFSFSAEKYRHLYVYTFDQVFFSAVAESPRQRVDLFSSPSSFELREDALFLQEVKYGRRLYLLLESEFALDSAASHLSGGLEWIVISAKLQQQRIATKASKHIRIRIQSQAGTSVVVTDYTKLQATIAGYFNSPCSEHPIAPLSYKAADLSGAPVSLLTNAFLDGQHCLKSPKARVYISEIKIAQAENHHHDASEEIYGSVNLHLYNALGRKVYRNGQSIESSQGPCMTPTATMIVARQDAPLKLCEGKPESFGIADAEKYIDIDITSLDMTFHFEPIIKEKVATGDRTFAINPESNKNLRQMLLEGSTATTFQCRHESCLLELTVNIEPL